MSDPSRQFFNGSKREDLSRDISDTESDSDDDREIYQDLMKHLSKERFFLVEPIINLRSSALTVLKETKKGIKQSESIYK